MYLYINIYHYNKLLKTIDFLILFVCLMTVVNPQDMKTHCLIVWGSQLLKKTHCLIVWDMQLLKKTHCLMVWGLQLNA